MTQIKVDNVVDAAGTAAADFTSGLTVAGAALSTLNTAEYYETGTEPTSPKNGAIWKDTANDKVMVYIAGEFKEVELGVVAASWAVDLTQASYDSVSFSITSQSTNPFDMSISSDGTKMYVLDISSDLVYQYSLSTAFDLSTASYSNTSFSTFSQDGSPTGLAFNSDGTKMYMVGQNSGNVFQYSLSTGFDLSTASYDSVSFSISAQVPGAYSLVFNPDGTKMYLVSVSNDSVHQYSLTTGFDISTASYDAGFSVASQDGTPIGVAFNPDGTKMYVLGYGNDSMFQYSLSTGFDISTASYDSVTFSTASQDTGMVGPEFNSDGTKMYLLGNSNANVYQYSTGL